MKPEIFMDNFERTNFSDDFFSAIGRALTIASRYEKNCKSLSILLGMKENKNIFADDIEYKNFVKTVTKQKLFDDIKAISGNNQELSHILNAARIARNTIAHELTIGLDCLIDTLPKDSLSKLENDLVDITNKLADADLIISFLVTKLTNETMPNENFLTQYRSKIVKWVVDIGDN